MEDLATSWVTAIQTPLLPCNRQHPLLPIQRADMPCSHPMADSLASTGLGTQAMPLKTAATTTMAAASVVPTAMVLEAASLCDPCWVTTPLNPDRVEALLHKYCIFNCWQQHIVTGLHMLESKSHHFIPISFENHHSSHLDPTFINKYIAQEQAAGHYSQAFLPKTLEALIGPFHTLPLGLVPKPHSDSLWLIQDMSFPRNN